MTLAPTWSAQDCKLAVCNGLGRNCDLGAANALCLGTTSLQAISFHQLLLPTLDIRLLTQSPIHFHGPDSFTLECCWLAPPQPPAELESDHCSATSPFDLGARSCIGQDVACSGMRLLLARLVWAFDTAGGGEKPLGISFWWRSSRWRLK